MGEEAQACNIESDLSHDVQPTKMRSGTRKAMYRARTKSHERSSGHNQLELCACAPRLISSLLAHRDPSRPTMLVVGDRLIGEIIGVELGW